MNNIVIRNIEPQEIRISGGGEVLGIQKVYVNGIDVTVGSAAYVIVPTKTSELINDSGFITSESDPTVPSYVKAISLVDINNWNNKQNQLVSGTNIKTINGDSILGAGNLTIDTTYSAGTGIEITEENVINNTITSYDDLTDLPTIPDKTSDLLNDSGYVVDTELAEVAFNGSYLALSNTPTIPDSTSQLVNDSGYINIDLLWSLFPKSTGSGTSVNLTDTVKNAPLYLTLGATALSQDGTPTPSSPEDIHTISGSNKVVVCGKNLFDKNNHNIYNGYFIGTGTTTITSESANNIIYISCQPNTQYAVSKSAGKRFGLGYTTEIPTSGVSVYNANSNNSGTSISITTGNDAKYLAIYVRNGNISGELTLQQVLDSLQIEYGNTVTTYTPYVSQEADIDLGDIEYGIIGTYEDKFIRSNDGTWQLEKNIGKVVLDGTENWQQNATYQNVYFIDSFLTDATTYETRPMLSNYFQYGGLITTGSSSVQIGKFYQWVSLPQRLMLGYDTTDLATFKTWLSTHNTDVYYPLANPEYLPITGTLAEQLETIYKDLTAESEQTNISQVNADLPFTISATTLKSLTNL